MRIGVAQWYSFHTASEYGTGAVDDKDLVVSSDQGNAWLFVHPYRPPLVWTVLRCVWLLGRIDIKNMSERKKEMKKQNKTKQNKN